MQLLKAISISRHLSSALNPACTKRPRIESFKLSSRAIRATNDCFTTVDNRRYLIRLHSFSDSMNLLRCCSYGLSYSIERLAPSNHTPFAPYCLFHNIKFFHWKSILINIFESVIIRVYILFGANWCMLYGIIWNNGFSQFEQYKLSVSTCYVLKTPRFPLFPNG